MTTVAPPLLQMLMPAAPAGGNPAVAVIDTPSPELSRLAVGHLLGGVIVATQGRGQVAIQTNLGTFMAQLSQPLPPGSALTFQVLSLVPQVQLLIAAVDGRPTGGLMPQATPAPLGGSAPPIPTGSPGPVTVTSGQSIPATVLRGIPLPQAPAMPAALPAATSPPPAATPVGPGLLLAASPTAPTTVSPPPTIAAAPLPETPLLPPLPPGTRIAVRVLDIATSPSAAPQVPPPPLHSQAGVVLRGTVETSTPQGQPVVRTVLGPLALETRAALPVGAQVTLQVEAEPETLRALAVPARPWAPPVLTRQWPALDEAVAALRQASPEAAQRLIDRILPKPQPGGLAAGLLFFLSAVRGGDLAGWFGASALRLLERDRPDLVGRLKQDVEEPDGVTTTSADKQWRIVALPIYGDPLFDQARLYVKQRPSEGEDNEEGKGEGGTRFVFDVTLSRLGRLQLDGLAKRDKNRLDLIVRTAEALPAALRSDINALFTDTALALGVSGRLTFQVSPRFVDVEPSPLASAHGSITV